MIIKRYLSVLRHLTVFVWAQETFSFWCALYHDSAAPVNWDPLWQRTGPAYPSVSLEQHPLQLVSKSGVFSKDSSLTVYCCWWQVLHPVTFNQEGDQTTTTQPLSRAAFYWYCLPKCLRIAHEHLPLRRQSLLNMVFLDLVKINLAFSHLFGCHFSHDIAMMGREVPTFFLGKHK